MRHIALIALFVCGCQVSSAPVAEDLTVEQQLADHEARIVALEGGGQPSPVPSGHWEKLSYAAAVETAHVKANILRDAAAMQFGSPQELADYLRSEIPQREEKVYAQIKAAFAVEFRDGWSWERHREILLEQAEGYEAVQ